jgi:hypothetical protein
VNHRITGQFSSRAAAPGVFGALLVLCLNLAVLPCAMALGIDDQACPHRPAAEQSAMGGHHEHGTGHGTEHASDAADQSHPDCMSTAASCCDLGMASVDSRSVQLKIKDGFDDDPWAISGIASTLQPVASYAITVAADPPDPPGTSVPRHVLFCVYLD